MSLVEAIAGLVWVHWTVHAVCSGDVHFPNLALAQPRKSRLITSECWYRQN